MSDDSIGALAQRLKSESESERLSAARELLRRAPIDPALDQAVRDAYARETVPWVRGNLAEAIAVTDGFDWNTGFEVPAPVWDATLEGLDPEVAREVIHTSTGRVLHEVSAVVGRARLAAMGDLGERYDSSETRHELEYLSDVCTGLRVLSGATSAPKIAEFDLAEELRGLGARLAEERICPLRCNGPDYFVVKSDLRLIRLAAQNVLLNAFEATLSVGAASDDRAVVLTWGVSADGFHVTVIDRGPGPPRSLTKVRNAGFSTKEGHPGFGLATANEALRSVGGSVRIRRNDRGGATVVLSWKELS